MFENEVRKCTEILKKGGVILYPTDTVWGLGCDATRADAVEKIYDIKKREAGKSLIILAADEAMLSRCVREVPAIAWDLIRHRSAPLTIVFPGALWVAENTCAPDGSVGIRIPDHDFCLALIRRFRRPIVSTSANISGNPVPQEFREIDPDILGRVDYVVNLPDGKKGARPSSIIRLGLGGEVVIIRK